MLDEGVDIGECVDLLVEGHARAEGFGETLAGTAFDPVRGDVADEDAGIGRGEEGVGEEVHGSSVGGRGGGGAEKGEGGGIVERLTAEVPMGDIAPFPRVCPGGRTAMRVFRSA